MGRFLGARDLDLFRRLSQELVQQVMDVEVNYIKINPQKMTINTYGQAKGGFREIYKVMKIHCLVSHTPQQFEFAESTKYKNNTVFKFLCSTLKKHNLYPEIGDYISWNQLFWQVNNVTQQQLIGNMDDIEWSKIVNTTVVSNSKVKQFMEFKL